MLREDPAYADKAARIASLARDVTEIVEELGLQTPAPKALAAACASPITRRARCSTASAFTAGQRHC